MAEKQKPARDLVKAAAKGLKKPKTMKLKTIQRISGRLLDDQKNDPQPHKPAPHKKPAKSAPKSPRRARRRKGFN
ncbi:MAG TPA: hypothetical protein DHU55_14440 [Blastocatellia bacterium]|jgi:hypothetical protein|nr:hypothetical protein [Blastocatellia bacterium]